MKRGGGGGEGGGGGGRVEGGREGGQGGGGAPAGRAARASPAAGALPRSVRHAPCAMLHTASFDPCSMRHFTRTGQIAVPYLTSSLYARPLHTPAGARVAVRYAPCAVRRARLPHYLTSSLYARPRHAAGGRVAVLYGPCSMLHSPCRALRLELHPPSSMPACATILACGSMLARCSI